MWHDVLRERGKEASGKRKNAFDRKTVDRQLQEGDLVLCRVPGMSHKLEESWHGPYPVVERMSRVDYRVELGRGRKKVLHINNLKRYFVREEEVMRLAVVAEDWEGDSEIGTKTAGRCEEFEVDELEKMKKEYPEVFSDLPGKTGVCRLVFAHQVHSPYLLHPTGFRTG